MTEALQEQIAAHAFAQNPGITPAQIAALLQAFQTLLPILIALFSGQPVPAPPPTPSAKVA